MPGSLIVTLLDGEINNKNDKNDTIIVVSCGEQMKELKSKAPPGKNAEWKETIEFKISPEGEEETILFIVGTPEKKGLRMLGIAGQSLYHVTHQKEVEKNKIRLWDKDMDVGFLNFELFFKPN